LNEAMRIPERVPPIDAQLSAMPAAGALIASAHTQSPELSLRASQSPVRHLSFDADGRGPAGRYIR
jgi:hypothetical protein